MAKKSDSTIENLAGEIGRIFGTTEAHARNWLGQRKALLDALHAVRERATDLIEEVGSSVRNVAKKSVPAAAHNRAERRTGGEWTDAMRKAARARMKKYWAMKKTKKKMIVAKDA